MANAPHPVVLIVDDEPSARATLEALLHPEGYTLRFAESAEAALTLIQQEPPDTILMDLMMPGMDGLEACEQIRANPLWRHIPIILVTALDSKEDLRRGLASGATDFISKPVNGTEIRARTRSMLRIKWQYDRLQGLLQLREDMANMVVHDMRSPLTSILGYAELLRKNLSTDQDRADLDRISSEARRMNGYFSDLLLLAKMEADRLVVHRSDVDINLLVQRALEHHRIMAQAKGLVLKTDLAAVLPSLSADANLLGKVMDNLMGNAIKYSDDQGQVTVRTRFLEQEGMRGVEIRVEDLGPGIPQGHQQSIFDKYNIIEMKKKGVSQIGLGLAFCKMAVEAHGWTIRVEDNRPKGAVFVVTADLESATPDAMPKERI